MGRAPCCDKDGLKKGPWLPEEDQKLIDYIQEHGPGNWRSLPKKAGLQRCGKSCRLRWTNYLRPDIKRGRFTFEEEEAIIQLHSILGNKWSAIAAKLPGRTDNEIKNYWNTHVRKRLLRMGIDPVTHTRRLDLLNLPSILNPTLQNPSQLNMLKLLGLQSLVNPELLRLATLLSTSHNENLNLLLQNHLQTNCGSNPMQNQFNPIVQSISHQIQTPLENTPIVGNAHVMEPKLEQYPENISGFDAQNLENQWQKNNLLVNSVCGTVQDSCENNVEPSNNSLHVSDDRAFMDSLFDSCAFQPSSVFSSPCSSQQTPVHPNGSSSSSSEDETDSYCENLLNFDFPVDFFDVRRS